MTLRPQSFLILLRLLRRELILKALIVSGSQIFLLCEAFAPFSLSFIFFVDAELDSLNLPQHRLMTQMIREVQTLPS